MKFTRSSPMPYRRRTFRLQRPRRRRFSLWLHRSVLRTSVPCLRYSRATGTLHGVLRKHSRRRCRPASQSSLTRLLLLLRLLSAPPQAVGMPRRDLPLQALHQIRLVAPPAQENPPLLHRPPPRCTRTPNRCAVVRAAAQQDGEKVVAVLVTMAARLLFERRRHAQSKTKLLLIKFRALHIENHQAQIEVVTRYLS